MASCQWEWTLDGHHWTPFDAASSERLERAFTQPTRDAASGARHGALVRGADGAPASVDFGRMLVEEGALPTPREHRHGP